MCGAATKGWERDPCWRDVGTGEREEPCNGDDMVQGSTGDNEANKKEMQIWRLQAKNVGLEQRRREAPAPGRMGSTGRVPDSSLPSAKCILHPEDTQNSPRGAGPWPAHLSGLSPPSQLLPEPAPSLPADPFLFFLISSRPCLPPPPLFISPAPLHLPQSELFFPLATL